MEPPQELPTARRTRLLPRASAWYFFLVSDSSRLKRLEAIIPLRATLVRRVVQVLAAVMLLWLGVYLGLNDRRLGRLVTKVVSGGVRGQFKLGYAHYSYWSGLASLLLNIPVPVEGGDFEMIDPNGDPVLRAPRVTANMYIGELVRGLLRTAVSAPFGRGSFIELHFSSGRLSGAWGHVRPVWVKKLYPPGVTGPDYGFEVNIVSTMSSKQPKPEDAPPSPGHVRITVDGAGMDFDNVTYQMTFPGWHGRVEELSGNATLRMSTDAAENRPGLTAFSYEVAPMQAKRGVLVLGATDESSPSAFVFPLADLDLRRFGARPSRRQDLAFRGKLKAADALVELDGKLVDKYCDTGVQLDLSFEQGGGLVKLVPGKLLHGQPRGRVRFFGPLSSTLPVTVSGKRHPCLSDPGHTKIFPDEPEGRTVVIEGQLAEAEAEVASIEVKGEVQGEVQGKVQGGVRGGTPVAVTVPGGLAYKLRAEGGYITRGPDGPVVRPFGPGPITVRATAVDDLGRVGIGVATATAVAGAQTR